MYRSHLPLLAASSLLLLNTHGASAQLSPTLEKETVAVTRPESGQVVTGRAWLALPGQAALATAVAAIYNPASPAFHRFFNWSTLTPYLPTAAQARAVQQELAANHLTVTAVDAHNLAVSFEGTEANFEAAFHTSIEYHTLANGSQVSAFTAAPALENGAAGLVQAVTGVGMTAPEPAIVEPKDPITGKPVGIETLAQAAAEATVAAPPNCILPPKPAVLNTPGQLIPDGAYVGPIYGVPISGVTLNSTGKCGYTPEQFSTLEGLDSIHAAGYTGTGQTIALLEEVGSPTLASDVAAFDTLYNLPAADLQIVNLTTFTQPDTAFKETTLDTEWAHATAPGARLDVIDTNGDDLMYGLTYVMENNLANVVSISYGSFEGEDDPSKIQAWNQELMLASAMHINVDVCSQDYGDDVAAEGTPDVDVPGDSPYATSVGGLSIAYVPGTNQLYRTSWGTNLTLIGTDGAPLATPEPIAHGDTKFGGGGGVSAVFTKPAYQSALPGAGRHLPDVSDLADGYTGVKVVVTDPAECTENPCVEVTGGTSLATPVFSGKWALLDQLVGAPLGQAAPLIAQYAGTAAVEDIVPEPEVAVSGATLSTLGLRSFSPAQLVLPETAQPFVSALFQETETGSDYVLSFGTDSSLAVTPGYDSATGWGQFNLAAIFSMLSQPATHP